MRAIRTCCLLAVFAASACLWAPSAIADDAEVLYDPGAVVFVDLTLTAEAEDDLEAEPDEYVMGTFSMTKSSDGTPSGEEPTPFVSERPAEIRLKGSIGGSFRELKDKKAAFKLKFKKVDSVLGLRKMTLNNMVQDPSMVHETLAYAAFRETGVPASRTGYAYVRVNGEDFGVYLNLENLDDIGLARIFGSFDDETQHLYEGERGDDVFSGGAGGFEIDEGPDDRSDLEALVDAANGTGGGPWSTRVAPHAELTEMTRMWAVEKYIEAWDGYAGHTEPGQERPNNYFLYSEPSGLFQMLPWGADQTWESTAGIPGREVTFDGSGGVLFNKCLEDSECFRAYWAGLNLATHTIPALDPGTLAEETAALLAPWQAQERANGRPEFDEGEVEDGVEETLDFIAGRQAETEAWLAENEPPAIVAAEPPAEDQAQSPTTPLPVALFARSERSGRYLTTRLQLSTAGTIALRVSMKTPNGRKRVCAAGKAAAGAAEWPVSCKLSQAAMNKLDRGALWLKLVFTVTPADGSAEALVRSIRLARDS